MEHHDVMAECDRFTLDKYREEVFRTANSRSTPPLGLQVLLKYICVVINIQIVMQLVHFLDYSSACTPINISGGIASSEISNGEDDTFWSPSMSVPPHSPQFPVTSHEQRSAPSTPNNNKSGTSPPEAAVEATPETTPVKVYLKASKNEENISIQCLKFYVQDLRKMSTRQEPTGSCAVRALTELGNGTEGPNSRPSTPIPLNPSVSGCVIGSGDTNNAHGFIPHKLSKLIADRQTINQQRSSINVDEDGRFSEMNTHQNGKNDSWQEDQEVLYFLYFCM